jgi:hypothetical protein
MVMTSLSCLPVAAISHCDLRPTQRSFDSTASSTIQAEVAAAAFCDDHQQNMQGAVKPKAGQEKKQRL